MNEENTYCTNCDTYTKEFDDVREEWICPCEEEYKYSLCVLCGGKFEVGEDGNELGFCIKCQEKEDFPYDLDLYYEDYDNNKVVFKGFETMDRGILERYRK